MCRMRKRFAVLIVVSLGGLPRPASAGDLDAFLPLKREPQRPDRGALPQNRVRGSLTAWMYAPGKGAALALHVQARQVGRYETEILAHPAGEATRRIELRPTAAMRAPATQLLFRASRAGVIPVRLETGANAAEVWPTGVHRWLILEASRRRPLHVISRVDRLYFFVPPSTRRFAVCARGGGGRENVRLHVLDPDGKPVAHASAEGARTAWVRAAVPARHRGRAWSLKADRPPDIDGVFEDAYLWLSDDVPPYVSPRPDTLLVPFVSGLVQPPRWRGREGVELAFRLNVEPPSGSRTLVLAVTGRDPITRPIPSAGQGGDVRFVVRRDTPPGEYPLLISLKDAGGKSLAEATSSVRVTGKLVFVGPPQPLVAAEVVKRPDAPPTLVVRGELSGADVPLLADVRLLRTDIPDPPGGAGARVILEKRFGDLGRQPRSVEPPGDLADGHYQWKVVARVGDEPADVAYAHFLVKRGGVFAEVAPPPGGALPVLGEEDRRRGFLGFVPDAVDAIAFEHRPTPGETARPLRIELARDEYEPATFGVWAAREMRGLAVTATPLRRDGGSETLPLDIRVARYWPQRVSWNTSTYRVIPEMLEPARPFDLAMDEVRQVWLTVHAAADATPGVYRATVSVRSRGGAEWKTPLAARVLGFRLLRPPHVHWGLYSDSARWRRYPDEQVAAELKDVVEHGVTALMCYPLVHSKVTFAGGELHVDDAEFFRHMRLARGAGLRPPWVMSLQPLNGMVRRLTGGKPLGDPAFGKLFQAIAGHFARRCREEKLGECVWHTIDEPWGDEQLHRAATELGHLKALGLTTFTTAGPVPPALDRVLDVRCYARGYLLGSPALLADRSRETAASKDRLWWYGSGCYTGQDGNVHTNRFLTGFAFWASGAEGQWSWTFLRTKGDALDDFDGAAQREAKDACIVYPSTTGGAPIPTLQWEGIREGIDDYRCAWTLRQLAAGLPREQRAAAMAWQQAVPVRRGAGDFTAAKAAELRRRILREIQRLRAAPR